MNVVVLMGGDSPEREISLASGRAVAEALRRRGHSVEAIDIAGMNDVLERTSLQQADVVFPALHGGFGEDGHLQALLEIMQVPYALSGPLGSAVAMNKAASKRIMRGAGIPTPGWLLVTWDKITGRPRTVVDPENQRERGQSSDCTVEHIRQRVADEFGFPLVLKPNESGSSVAVSIVHDPAEFTTSFEKAAAESRQILIERYVAGRELTAAIFLSRRLPLLEIRPRAGFYDYANKYTPGASEYLVPAPVHSPLYEQISDDALRLFDLLECRGLARVDFRLDGDDYYCLEINTIPGMTDTSLVPMAAEAVGIDFGALVEDLCRSGMARTGQANPVAPSDPVQRRP